MSNLIYTNSVCLLKKRERRALFLLQHANIFHKTLTTDYYSYPCQGADVCQQKENPKLSVKTTLPQMC